MSRTWREAMGIDVEMSLVAEFECDTQVHPETYETSDARTSLSGDPEVGGTSVEDDLERLRGVTEGDRSVVLQVRVVCPRFTRRT